MSGGQLLGTILLFAGSYAPREWAFCDGAILPVKDNEALFSILGNTYGGNGTVSFALPDLRSRVPVGVGPGPQLTEWKLGEAYGSETEILSVGNLAVHNHDVALQVTDAGSTIDVTLNASKEAAASKNPKPTAFLAQAADLAGNANPVIYTTKTPNSTLGGLEASLTLSLDAKAKAADTGANEPLNIMQPFLALNYIIAIEGQYPVRS